MPQSCGPQSLAVTLRASPEGKLKLAAELYSRFHAMKTYGKEPESLENIIAVFVSDLEDYPTDKILKAIKTHSQRSQEFPTVSDIVGLIKRNGKPPLSKEIYISLSKKDAEHRTSADWSYIREYEAQAHDDEWGADERQAEDWQHERARLLDKVHTLETECRKLADLLKRERERTTPDPTPKTMPEKIAKTVDVMRNTGASEEMINEFLQNVKAA